MFAEHDPAAAAGRGEGRQRGLGANPDLAGAGGAAELLDAVGIHGRAATPGPQIGAARTERVRSLGQRSPVAQGHLAELDINPLMVLPRGQGVKAVDVLAVLRGT
jgi:hypothetical protein